MWRALAYGIRAIARTNDLRVGQDEQPHPRVIVEEIPWANTILPEGVIDHEQQVCRPFTAEELVLFQIDDDVSLAKEAAAQGRPKQGVSLFRWDPHMYAPSKL